MLSGTCYVCTPVFGVDLITSYRPHPRSQLPGQISDLSGNGGPWSLSKLTTQKVMQNATAFLADKACGMDGNVEAEVMQRFVSNCTVFVEK